MSVKAITEAYRNLYSEKTNKLNFDNKPVKHSRTTSNRRVLVGHYIMLEFENYIEIGFGPFSKERDAEPYLNDLRSDSDYLLNRGLNKLDIILGYYDGRDWKF